MRALREEDTTQTWFRLDLGDGLAEYYCSEDCARKENGIKSASEEHCWECGGPITGTPYTDVTGTLYCSIKCIFAANGIEEQTK